MLDREGVTGGETKTFAVEFQGAHRQRMCRVQIGLQEPHVRPPQLAWFCTVTWEGVSVLWKAVKSLDPNGSPGGSKKGARLRETEWTGKERSRAMACGLVHQGAGTSMFIWCRRRDLNPHGLRHTPLKRACLPFHHFGNRIREA